MGLAQLFIVIAFAGLATVHLFARILPVDCAARVRVTRVAVSAGRSGSPGHRR